MLMVDFGMFCALGFKNGCVGVNVFLVMHVTPYFCQQVVSPSQRCCDVL